MPRVIIQLLYSVLHVFKVKSPKLFRFEQEKTLAVAAKAEQLERKFQVINDMMVRFQRMAKQRPPFDTF